MASSRAAMLVTVLVVLAVVHCTNGVEVSARANPIRKVVTMLQMMSSKVEEEGKQAEVLFDKFMCYCESGAGMLKEQIAAAEEHIPALESSMKETAAAHAQLEGELAQHKEDRATAKEAIDTATAIRTKEAKAFADEAAESKANIDALARAIPAIEQGTAGFLQTGAAAQLRKLSVSLDMNSVDRDALSAFLSTGFGGAAGYAPQSGEILGILKQMKDEMEKDFADLQADENSAIGLFTSLVAAKEKEIGAATSAIEAKTARLGNLAVERTTLRNDHEDTTEALAEDQKFLANMDEMCKKKREEWEIYKKTQSLELVALADTIKLLNDDDALELFKKTLPGPEPAAAASFLQRRAVSRRGPRGAPGASARALRLLRGRGAGDRRMALLAMALRGRKAGFEDLIKMIDELAAVLAKEQKEDDAKKAWCEAEVDKTEDEIKALTRSVSDLEKAIDDQEDSLGTLESELAALAQGIAALDKEVVEATAQRKEEHAVYVEELAANTAAKSLLEMAKNRMQKFYNPKLYVAPPKRELSEEDRLTVNMGGTLAPTAPPGGIAGTGIAASFVQVGRAAVRRSGRDLYGELYQASASAEPGPAPEADLSYKKKGEESGGVLAMIDSIVADVVAQIQGMEMTEKEAQKDYEAFMKESTEKRATDAKSVADKEGAKAALEAEHQENKGDLKSTQKDLGATNGALADLHADCDWLIQNYALRKEARANEADALGKAKDVLNGASYSF